MADKKQSKSPISDQSSNEFSAIEAQLVDLRADVARLNTGLESLVKAQLMMGSIIENHQVASNQAMIEAISNEVIAKISQQLGQDASLLSDQMIGAIGTALGKRDAVGLANETSRKKPIEVMWSALSQFQPSLGKH